MPKILLLEPDLILADCYSNFLIQHGHNVIKCVDAQDAIEKCDQIKPDAVVLEPLLALHNGLEVIYELRSYKDFQKIPIIIQSYMPEDEFMISPITKRFGITAYIHKSTTHLTDLSQALTNLFAPA